MKFFFTETENEQASGVTEQAELGTATTQVETQEDVVTLPKSEFTKMNRKALAYDATKGKPIVQTKEQEVDPELKSRVDTLYEEREKRTFGYEHKLSPEETDYIFKVTGGKPSKEILDDPFVKGGLESVRQTKRVETNTPSTSKGAINFQGKDFKDLPEADQRKAYEERTKGILNK